MRSRPDIEPYWGGKDLPASAASNHFLVTGATGSGKTITIRMLMQSVLRAVPIIPGLRAVVYDAKDEYETVVRGIAPASVVSLYPFDSRAAQWAIGMDVTGPAAALQIASILVPEDKNSASPFFARAAQDIVYGTMLSFMEHGTDWTLRDILLATTSGFEVLTQVLKQSERNANRILSYASASNDTSLSVLATLQSKLSIFEPVAAAYADPSKPALSLCEWVNEESPEVLLIKTHQGARQATDAINQAIFQRLTELLLSKEVDPDDARMNPDALTWFFLDEVREAGHLPGLRSLLNLGRAKQVAVVLGFQDIEGLKAVYGESEALELIGQCGNKGLLRLENPSTAEWASSVCGYVREKVRSEGTSEQYGEDITTSSSSNVDERDRPLLLPSAFMKLPPTTLENGLQGYFKFQGATKIQGTKLKPLPVVAAREDPHKLWALGHHKAKNRHSESDEFLKPWTPEDYARLGFSISSDEKSSPPPRRRR